MKRIHGLGLESTSLLDFSDVLIGVVLRQCFIRKDHHSGAKYPSNWQMISHFPVIRTGKHYSVNQHCSNNKVGFSVYFKTNWGLVIISTSLQFYSSHVISTIWDSSNYLETLSAVNYYIYSSNCLPSKETNAVHKSKEISYMNDIDISWLVGLGVWFALRVREVPGSNPGRALLFHVICNLS